MFTSASILPLRIIVNLFIYNLCNKKKTYIINKRLFSKRRLNNILNKNNILNRKKEQFLTMIKKFNPKKLY